MTESEEKDQALFAQIAAQAVFSRALPGNGLQRLLDALHDEVRLMDVRELAHVATSGDRGGSAAIYARLARFELEERRKSRAA
jgi:hypothetical protein